MNTYYKLLCKLFEELAPYLEVLDLSASFNFDLLDNLVNFIDGSEHFPYLRELHIQSPSNDDKDREEDYTPLATFIRNHATQLETLSFPRSIKEFDKCVLYEPLDLPSLPYLTKLDGPVLWVKFVTDRHLLLKLEELKVRQSLPRGRFKHQTQETSKLEVLEPLLTRLHNVHALYVLDLAWDINIGL